MQPALLYITITTIGNTSAITMETTMTHWLLQASFEMFNWTLHQVADIR